MCAGSIRACNRTRATGHGSAQSGCRVETQRTENDQAFIGSCGQRPVADLGSRRTCARQHHPPGVRLLVTPASQAVYREASAAAIYQDITDAGGASRNSTCGAAVFGSAITWASWASSEVCITRAPATAKPAWAARGRDLHASPATVAASAIHGYIHRQEGEREHEGPGRLGYSATI